MNPLHAPHIFNHFECNPSNAARTWLLCLLWLVENCALLHLTISITFFSPVFPFHSFCFVFFPLCAWVVIVHVSVCCHPLTKSCGIWGCKVDVWYGPLRWAAHTLYEQSKLSTCCIFCLLSASSASCYLIFGLNQNLTSLRSVFWLQLLSYQYLFVYWC